MAAFDVKYFLDNVSLVSFGIIVTSSKGLISKPEAKGTLSAEWSGHNGVTRDLSSIMYKGRNIELACAMEANGYNDFIKKINSFLGIVTTGSHVLRWQPGSDTPKELTVTHSKQIDISKEWNPGKMVGSFTLKFEEIVPGELYTRISSYDTPEEPTDGDVHYYIDGMDLRSLGVQISASSGLFCKPQEKDTLTVDWQNNNGVQKDLSTIRYKERSITLNCFVSDVSYKAFVTAMKNICALLSGSGTHRLRIQAKGSKPLLYEVYHPTQVTITPGWNEATCVGTFSLKLVEPEPVKIVIRFNNFATISIQSTSIAHIYWGDGTHTFDVSGDGKPKTVTHNKVGIFDAIITVETTDVLALTSNGTVIWNRLV